MPASISTICRIRTGVLSYHVAQVRILAEIPMWVIDNLLHDQDTTHFVPHVRMDGCIPLHIMAAAQTDCVKTPGRVTQHVD